MPNGGPELPTTAVTVIGLGGAGCRMLDAVAEAVERADPEPAFGYLAVDSNEADLEEYAPETAVTLALEAPEARWERDRSAFSYLGPDTSPPPAHGGTGRSRAVARYYADNGASFERLYSTLEYAIDATVEDAAPQNGGHQVWVLNSLAGGTGSGLFPLVGAMLDDIIATRETEIVVSGLASLPRLDALEETVAAPGGLPELYINSYTALRELARLVDYHGTTDYPIEIEIESSPNGFAGDAIELSDSPFEVFGLLAADEGSLSRGDYREQINRAVADAVLALAGRSLQTARGGLRRYGPPGTLRPEGRLFAVDAAGVRFPAVELERYLELGETLDELETTEAHHREAADSLGQSARYVDETLHADTLEDAPLGAAESTVQDAVRELTAELRSGDAGALDSTPEAFEAVVDAVSGTLDPPPQVDEHAVAELVVARALSERLRSVLEEHPFRRRVYESAAAYGEGVRADGAEKRPLMIWENELRPDLEARRDRLSDELQEAVFRILKRSRLQNRLDEIEEELRALRVLSKPYTRIRDSLEVVRGRVSRGRSRLRDHRGELEDRRETELTNAETTREHWASVHAEREALGERLQDGRVGQYTTLAVEHPDGVAPERLERVQDFEALVESRILAPEVLNDAFRRSVEGLEDRIQDRSADRADTSRTSGWAEAVVLANQANRGFVLGDIEATTDDSEIPVTSALSRFDIVTEGGIDDVLSVAAVGLFSPIELELTSEFGALHDHYVDAARDLSAQFDSDISDADVTRRFAYPELFSEGTPYR